MILSILLQRARLKLNLFLLEIGIFAREWGILLKREYHGVAHVLAVANVTVYKPIGSKVLIRAGNLHVRVKESTALSSLIIGKFLCALVNFPYKS